MNNLFGLSAVENKSVHELEAKWENLLSLAGVITFLWVLIFKQKVIRFQQLQNQFVKPNISQ